jgi:sugar/nucleoside kinase (ribokinase family)
MSRYICIGGASIDHIILADGTQLQPQPGGSAFYAAVGAQIWDKDVGVVTLVSKDHPQEWIDQFDEAGVDTTGVARSDSSLGLEGTIAYQADGTRLLGAQGGLLKWIERAFPRLLAIIGYPIWQKVCPKAEQIPDEYLQASGAILAPIAYPNQSECLEAIHTHILQILLDPPPLMPGAPRGRVPKDLADLTKVDYVLPSEQENQEYFGDEVTPIEAAKRFYGLGARNVVVKLGERGAQVFRQDYESTPTIPIFSTQVVDITGAGDAFGGGFLVGLHETGDPVLAACYGAVSASFVIEGFGAHYALGVKREQAEERLNTFKVHIV